MAENAAALVSCCAAVAAAEAAVVAVQKDTKTNKLTVTHLDFEDLLLDSSGDAWFTKNLRRSKKTFLSFVHLLSSRNFTFKTIMARKHTYSKRVASVLYFYASSGSYRASAAAMGMNVSVLFEGVADMTEFMVGLLPEIVTFADWRKVEADFKKKQGIPGVTGAVDGSLIAIQRPDDYEGFYCRKCYPAINVQAIVDCNLRFMGDNRRRDEWGRSHPNSVAPDVTHKFQAWWLNGCGAVSGSMQLIVVRSPQPK